MKKTIKVLEVEPKLKADGSQITSSKGGILRVVKAHGVSTPLETWDDVKAGEEFEGEITKSERQVGDRTFTSYILRKSSGGFKKPFRNEGQIVRQHSQEMALMFMDLQVRVGDRKTINLDEVWLYTAEFEKDAVSNQPKESTPEVKVDPVETKPEPVQESLAASEEDFNLDDVDF